MGLKMCTCNTWQYFTPHPTRLKQPSKRKRALRFAESCACNINVRYGSDKEAAMTHRRQIVITSLLRSPAGVQYRVHRSRSSRRLEERGRGKVLGRLLHDHLQHLASSSSAYSSMVIRVHSLSWIFTRPGSPIAVRTILFVTGSKSFLFTNLPPFSYVCNRSHMPVTV